MKSFLTSPTGWMPAYTDEKKTTPAPTAQKSMWLDAAAKPARTEAHTPVMQTTGWTNISKRAKVRARVRGQTAAATKSGIVVRAGESGGKHYITVMLRQDVMTALRLKVGDRVTCEYADDWRAVRIYKDQDHGFKLTPTTCKSGQDRSGECIPSSVKIGLEPEDVGLLGSERIVVDLKHCIYDEGGLIARW